MTDTASVRPLLRRVLRLIVLLSVIYFGVLGWFTWKEDSYIYFPRKGLRNADSLGMGIETVRLQTSDGVGLVCWIIPAVDSSSVWVLYFHGNGGNISSRGYVEHYKELSRLGLNVFALEYRGYGLSEGTPSEQGLYRDAHAAFDYLVHQRNVPPRRIVLFGYSLGSAVATELATRVEAGAVILEGAFTSVYRLGMEHYPFLPAALLMRNRFDSLERIHLVTEPKLFLHAVQDDVVPIEHGQMLFAVAREPKLFVETGGGHNTAHTADSALFYGSIAKFLRQLQILN